MLGAVDLAVGVGFGELEVEISLGSEALVSGWWVTE
jgi:hypothetical protein